MTIDRWRSVLFVPGNRLDLMQKAPRSGAKAVVVDLEDAVPADAKPSARETVAEGVAALIETGVDVLVRVNPPATRWFADDVAALPASGLSGVVVPKLESPEDLDALAVVPDDVPVVAGLETVRGVADARMLLTRPVAGCYFGAEDYTVDLGGVRTAANAEVQVPRAMVAMAARLAGMPSFDMVVLDFRDTERFRSEAVEARALGYAGKLCIHPAQVAHANEAFEPSALEIERARQLLEVYDEAVAGGRATAAFDGTMVDEVVARHARAVLAASDALGSTTSTRH
jgi:citrate lyase subunit beta / citryl-CoA lyase